MQTINSLAALPSQLLTWKKAGMSSYSTYLLFICSGLITHPHRPVCSHFSDGRLWKCCLLYVWAMLNKMGPILVQSFKPYHNLNVKSTTAIKTSRQIPSSSQAHSLPCPR